MSEGIRKYIMISATIISIISNIGICWLFGFKSLFIMVFSYLIGIINGIILMEVEDEKR